MSSKFDHKKVMPRYSAIAIIMTIFAIAVVGKALYIMLFLQINQVSLTDRK